MEIIMRGEQLLNKALTTFEERRTKYGQPDQVFNEIAQRWSTTLGKEVTSTQVVLCMIDLKIARLRSNPANFDSIMDIAGYAACLWEVSE